MATRRSQNVRMVIITLGKDGAFAKVNIQYYHVQTPKIKVVNPVGFGDVTVAGIAIGIEQNQSEEDLLKRR